MRKTSCVMKFTVRPLRSLCGSHSDPTTGLYPLLPVARGSYGGSEIFGLSNGDYAVFGGPSSHQSREMSSLRVHHYFPRKKSGDEPGEDLRSRPSQGFNGALPGIATRGRSRI
jgi:hypothetical protein